MLLLMEDIFSNPFGIFLKYPRYKVFPLIYSIRDILKTYSTEPYNLCQLCFNSPVYGLCGEDMSEDYEFENINVAVINILNTDESNPKHNNIDDCYILYRDCLYSIDCVNKLV